MGFHRDTCQRVAAVDRQLSLPGLMTPAKQLLGSKAMVTYHAPKGRLPVHDSAMICAFVSTDPRRRRPVPVITSRMSPLSELASGCPYGPPDPKGESGACRRARLAERANELYG
jgi:hypothetical protein